MQLDVFNIDKFIEINNIKEVTNPSSFESNFYPTDDGIFSNIIFGLPGSNDRRTIFGYIDLKKPFFHPLIYKILSSKYKNGCIENCINGSKYYKIDKFGKLQEDNENGETGLEFLYENWEKLKLVDPSETSYQSNTQYNLIKSLKKDEIFVKKWLIIPAAYRDVNLANSKAGKIGRELINKYYTELIALSQTKDDFDFMYNLTQSKIQQILTDIFEKLTVEISGGSISREGVRKSGKTAIFKTAVLSKTIDYSTRSVISVVRVNSEKYEDQLIKITYTGLPLSHLCNLFFPFFQYEIKNWFEEIFSTLENENLKDKFINGLIEKKVISKKEAEDVESIRLDNPMGNYTPEKIKNLILLYIKSPINRLDRLYVPIIITFKNGKIVRYENAKLSLFQEELEREFLLVDLIFIIAHRVCEDKHVVVTRYPIDNIHNMYPSRIKIITTYKTKHAEIASMYFDDYPIIDVTENSPNATKESDFIDTVLLHNSYLAGMGADFDGKTN